MLILTSLSHWISLQWNGASHRYGGSVSRACLCYTRDYLTPLYPPLQRSWKGGILVSPCPSVRPSVRLSVCGQNRVRSVSSTILIGSISYLHILLSNFRRCVACNARFNIQKFEICNFDFVFFWLGIQYDSMVWVIMRRRGYPQNAGVLVVLVES